MYPRFNNKSRGLLTWRALPLLDIVLQKLEIYQHKFQLQKQQHPLVEDGGHDCIVLLVPISHLTAIR